eukprot:CAMPEP_0117071810 /NCGR_PEP_ID=MMETSP0472-20121206/50501_1 /TAXON_ID=693140 ORGANISM="Tiarina fusus, Strain LIS" /NCGR_SAMPLE_ID=MMETSP0472 /ASSEMBLY_ACC=CAM_ASM_000603 /LENGTH=63 /DNA_ID=CAMNT_0004795573 /DNA_START=83 /DNA_END=271 /DNA_ORIENTATION=+
MLIALSPTLQDDAEPETWRMMVIRTLSDTSSPFGGEFEGGLEGSRAGQGRRGLEVLPTLLVKD